jgi:hypothetical protein
MTSPDALYIIYQGLCFHDQSVAGVAQVVAELRGLPPTAAAEVEAEIRPVLYVKLLERGLSVSDIMTTARTLDLLVEAAGGAERGEWREEAFYKQVVGAIRQCLRSSGLAGPMDDLAAALMQVLRFQRTVPPVEVKDTNSVVHLPQAKRPGRRKVATTTKGNASS